MRKYILGKTIRKQCERWKKIRASNCSCASCLVQRILLLLIDVSQCRTSTARCRTKKDLETISTFLGLLKQTYWLVKDTNDYELAVLKRKYHIILINIQNMNILSVNFLSVKETNLDHWPSQHHTHYVKSYKLG